MDNQLDDSLSLDFEQSEDVIVSEASVSLDDSGHIETIPMEYEHINEEQPMLMESTSEGISDLMTDDFNLTSEGEYVVQEENVETSPTSDTMMDLNYTPQLITSGSDGPAQLTLLKSGASTQKEIAIAPKPTLVISSSTAKRPMISSWGRQYAIAPRPVAITSVQRPEIQKKLTITNILPKQKNPGQPVLSQIKQLVMMPGDSSHKIKLVAQRPGQSIQGQIVSTKNVAGSQTIKKTVMGKVIVQGQSSVEQPAVITKLGPGAHPPRFVSIQPKGTGTTSTANVTTVPSKVEESPTKQGQAIMRLNKKHHIIPMQAVPAKVMMQVAPKVVNDAVKNYLVTNGSQSKILKPVAAEQKVTKKITDVPLKVPASSRSQIYQIKMPGKGVQYIRMVSATPPAESAPPDAAAQSKTVIVTDTKGNIIRMSSKKVDGVQHPLLVVSGASSGLPKVVPKPQQKLVKIAPLVKTTKANTMQASVRAGASLLAPRTDSLAALVHDALAGQTKVEAEEEVTIEQEDNSKLSDRSENVDNSRNDSMDFGQDEQRAELPLIVIPAEFERREKNQSQDNSYKSLDLMAMNTDVERNVEQSPTPPPDNVEEIDSRLRKACNCTKSQCLKLYCDCFANGEFCNRCNCTNCHNNMDFEELRQKAIRSCLERNPNAFRPKIGKTRATGPETIRRHTKGCNCKRSGCLKNYCECYEAKIACTAMCKCVGCRNVEEELERLVRGDERHAQLQRHAHDNHHKQPCSFLTLEVIEAVCQCLVAAAGGGDGGAEEGGGEEGEGAVGGNDRTAAVLDEFARCLHDVIGAARHPASLEDISI